MLNLVVFALMVTAVWCVLGSVILTQALGRGKADVEALPFHSQPGFWFMMPVGVALLLCWPYALWKAWIR